FLTSFLSSHASGSKPFTSPAKRVVWRDGSNSVMGAIPDRPARIACHVSSVPTPRGETSPMPVTTTRRLAPGDRRVSDAPVLTFEHTAAMHAALDTIHDARHKIYYGVVQSCEANLCHARPSKGMTTQRRNGWADLKEKLRSLRAGTAESALQRRSSL